MVGPERPAPSMAGASPPSEVAAADRTDPTATAAEPPKATTCEPRVTEVLFVPDGAGLSVTILGEGFCMGAAPATAKFGDIALTHIVVASSGKSMAGRVDRMPPSGAGLELHTPPGRPVLTTYVVP